MNATRNPQSVCDGCDDSHAVTLTYRKGTTDEVRDRYCQKCADYKLAVWPEYWTAHIPTEN